MKTIFCLEQPYLFTNLSPLKPKLPTLLQPRTTTTFKVHAKAKGFGVTPNKVQEKESGVPKKSYQTPKENNAEEDDDDDKIPQVVLDRLIVRILVYVGVPLLTGMVMLQGFSVVKEQNMVDVPVWLPYLTLFITFGASTLGIAIGALSTSWDPDKKGSFIGFEEAQRNWIEMWKEEVETYK